jgi:hypothetical protein
MRGAFTKLSSRRTSYHFLGHFAHSWLRLNDQAFLKHQLNVSQHLLWLSNSIIVKTPSNETSFPTKANQFRKKLNYHNLKYEEFKMKILLVITSILYSINCFSQELYYNKKLLESDLDSLIAIVTMAHPNPYAYLDKNQFESLIVSKKSSLPDSATKSDFFKIISPIMTSIKDAHSFLLLDQKEYIDSNGLFLSFGIRIIDNKIIVNKDSKGILNRGQEIESINGVLSSKILEHLKNLSTPEGFVLENQLNEVERKFYLYLPIIVDIKNENFIKLKDSLISYPGSTFQKSQSSIDKNYEYFNFENIPVLRFHSIGGGPFPFELKRFMRRSMRKVRDLQSEYLVIDLRNNRGGNVTFINHILAYFAKSEFKIWDEIHLKRSTLTQKSLQKFTPFKFLLPLVNYPIAEVTINKSSVKPKKKRYLGNVILITNQNTFSAAAMLADSFKKNGLGIIIGEQYASSASHSFGQNEQFILPNTKIRGKISTWEYFRKGNVVDDYCKVDYLIRPQVSEKDLSEDNLLKWVVEKVKSGKLKSQSIVD